MHKFLRCLQWLYPHICVLCGSKVDNDDLDLCVGCLNDLPRIERACICCARPLPVTRSIEAELVQSSVQDANNMLPLQVERERGQICGACLKRPPVYQRTLSLYHYSTPIDYLLLALKFHNKLVYGQVLGTLLARFLQQYYATQLTKPEIIIPIPLHKSRLRERGYNQAVELARPIAKLLQIAIDKHCCIRIKKTSAQSLLAAKERKKNIAKAFGINIKSKNRNGRASQSANANVNVNVNVNAAPEESVLLPYQYVAVIDDVITTGNTINEFCRELHRAGVQKIDVWSCARATRR